VLPAIVYCAATFVSIGGEQTVSAAPGISPSLPLRPGRSWYLTSEATYRPAATDGLPSTRARIEDWIERPGQIIERLTVSHSPAIVYTVGHAWRFALVYARVPRISSVASLSAHDVLPVGCRKPDQEFAFFATLAHLPTTQKLHDALLAAIARLPGVATNPDMTDALGRRGTTSTLGRQRITYVQETGAILEVANGPLTQTFLKADVVTGAPQLQPPTKIGTAPPRLALVARALTRSC
jgi:hypothetical protein